MVSIIIPVHNQENYTKACIESIYANTSDYELIVIDNGSLDDDGDKLVSVDILPIDLVDFYYSGELSLTMISNIENLGFPKAVNQGIEAAKGDVIAILNNDLILTPSWLEILQGHLLNGFDMIGPVTNSISGPQQVLIDQYDDLTTLYKAAGEHRKKNEGQSYPYHRLVYVCVALKRQVIDKNALLDEIYTPGTCEADDFCMRAIEAGFKLGIAKDVYIHHFGSVTHKAMDLNYRELIAKNQKIFNDKWADRYKEMVKGHNG